MIRKPNKKQGKLIMAGIGVVTSPTFRNGTKGFNQFHRYFFLRYHDKESIVQKLSFPGFIRFGVSYIPPLLFMADLYLTDGHRIGFLGFDI